MAEIEELAALGREIRKHRKALGVSQEELAERAGLHRNYIGMLERGERNPRVTVLVQLARALGVRVSDLMTGMG